MHCRQGHGRTGTSVTTLTRLLQIYYGKQGEMSIAETLVTLRQQRRYLVEMQEQFRFIESFTSSKDTLKMISDLQKANALKSTKKVSQSTSSKQAAAQHKAF